MTQRTTDTLQPAKRPEAVGISPEILRRMEKRIEVALQRGVAPGAVLLVAKDQKIVRFRAYGNRQTDPVVPMTANTLFDLASVSKIVGTATATLLLVEDGTLSVDDPVAKYLPEFAAEGKGDVTVRDLLTHRSGLKSYEDVERIRKTSRAPAPADNLIEYVARLPKLYPTGQYTVYSCLNFLTLARVNEVAAGESQQSLLSRRVWKPLGMNDTGYSLTDEQKARVAPTFKGSAWQPGVIHDPLANYYGTSETHCPGNAGLFSSAGDLAIYCQMILNEGTYGGVRVFKPETIRMMTSPQSTLPLYDAAAKGPGDKERRGFGWIVYLGGPYRSEKAPDGSFIGHTGYTGTYVWIDKHDKSFILLLSNAVYSKDPPGIDEYRKEVTKTFLDSLWESQ